MRTQELVQGAELSSLRTPTTVSVVMPCLNEAETIETCISKARSALKELEIPFEIVVADSGSTDGSEMLAEYMPQKKAMALH